MKTLDKIIKAYEAGESRALLKIDEFNEILTDERTLPLVQSDVIALTQTSAEIGKTGIYAKYKTLEIYVVKRDGTINK